MAAPMVRTKHPGIYKRGSRYVVRYRADGKHRTESARTLDDARRLLSKRRTEVDGGEYRTPTRETLAEYARRWIDAYQGSGSGFRERTREDYRRDLERYVIPFLGARMMTAIRRRDVKAFAAWLVDDEAQAERHAGENAQREKDGKRPLRTPGPLADGTVSRVMAVLSACFTSAVDDEVRRDNPASRIVLAKRDRLRDPGEDDSDANAKALTRAELRTFLSIVHSDWRVFFQLLAATGLRVSEALALDVAHLRLDGSRPVVKVRRAVDRHGRMDNPKSRHGRREVPLPPALVLALRAHLADRPAVPASAEARFGQLVFRSATGAPMNASNVRNRVLKPAAEEADVGWAGFHAFRHSYASMHIARGTNIVQISRLLGHHDPAFTLRVYAHLLDDGTGDPLDLDVELAESENKVRTGPTGTGDTVPDVIPADLAA